MTTIYLENLPLNGAGTIDFYKERQKIEAGLTAAILHALPAGRLDYTPHPLSQTARAICETLVRCLRVCRDLAGSADVEMTFDPPLDKQHIVERFSVLSRQLGEQLAGRDQTFWQASVRVTVDGSTILEHSRGEILWLFLFDSIHHRGQLSTYLRPMGSKVPSIYGASLDGSL
jgi:hypothetical protein